MNFWDSSEKIIVPIPTLESSNKNNVHFRRGGLENIDFAKTTLEAHSEGSTRSRSRGVATCKNRHPHARRGAQQIIAPTMVGMPILLCCNTPWAGTRLQKVIHFQMLFRMFSKVSKFRCLFCTPQAFWASHFLKLQNWRSPNVTLTAVSWTATLAAWEVFKKLGFAFLRPQDELFFVLRA